MKRFYDKLRASETGCMIWTGVVDTPGYGHTTLNNRPIGAHRLAWLLERGEIPEGLQVLHRCDNRRCCNVEHLFLGTNADNVRDKVAKNRQCKGSRRPLAKLSEDQIQNIKDDPRSHRVIGADYGVTHGIIGRIKRGEAWRSA